MNNDRWIPTTYERIPYEPNGSTSHDHLCSCPWCMPDAPDVIDPDQLEDDPNLTEDRLDVVPGWQYKSFDW